MQHIEFSVLQEGYVLRGKHFPATNAIANLALVHGMGEHQGRYYPVIEFLNSKGFNVSTIDLIGHGISDGKRGYAPGLEYLLDSVFLLLSECQRQFSGLKQFLYGHSMGGNICTNYVMRRKPELAGFVCTSPWYELFMNPPELQVLFGRVMSAIYPKFTLGASRNGSVLHRDEVRLAERAADDLIHHRVSGGLFFPLFAAGIWVTENTKELETPMLLTHGTGDQLTSYKASKKFADRCQHKDFTFKSWEGQYHELHNDLDRDIVMQYIADWMFGQLGLFEQQSRTEVAA